MGIDSELLDVLKAWKQTTEFGGQDDWVFASPAQVGRLPWSADSVNDAYVKATEKAQNRARQQSQHAAHIPLMAGRCGNFACCSAETNAPRGHKNDHERVRRCGD